MTSKDILRRMQGIENHEAQRDLNKLRHALITMHYRGAVLNLPHIEGDLHLSAELIRSLQKDVDLVIEVISETITAAQPKKTKSHFFPGVVPIDTSKLMEMYIREETWAEHYRKNYKLHNDEL